MVAAVFFAAAAILCCTSAEGGSSVSTSLLLPDGLFSNMQFVGTLTFLGQVTVTRSTTFYIIACDTGAAATYFDPEGDCSGSSYIFSEISASTQYLVDE